MTKLTTQAGRVSLGRGVAAMAGLATAMILSRMLDEHAYGTYRQVWLVFFTLAPILELGIPPSVSFFLPQLTRPDLKPYLVQHSTLLLLSGAVMGLGCIGLGDEVGALFGNPDLGRQLRLFALFPALTLPFHMTENTLVALGHGGKAGWVSAGSALLQMGVILGALQWGGSLESLFWALSIWALVRWIASAASLYTLTRRLPFRWNLAMLRSQVFFAMPMAVATMAGVVGRHLDKVVISSFFTPEQYAIYANGSYDIPLINILTMSVTAVLVPSIVRARMGENRAEVKRLWHGSARRLAWALFPASVLLFLLAEPFMILLFSSKYAASAGPFRVLVLILPIRIAMHSAFLRALGSTQPILRASLLALASSLILALILVRVPALGLLGPAIAAVVGSYLAVVYTIHVVVRILGWRWRDYFPWRALGAMMLVALAAALPALASAGWMSSHSVWLRLLVPGTTYGAAYLLLGWLTGAAHPREWLQALNDLLRRR
jgi:O-antigen/teichoic acid export membrane protein